MPSYITEDEASPFFIRRKTEKEEMILSNNKTLT